MNCEIRSASWCIAEGVNSILRELSSDPKYDRIWTISDYFKADYKLVILEPNNCKSGFADQVQLISTEANYVWNNSKWNRADFKLTKVNGCILAMLFSMPSYDTSKWSHPLNLELIRPCKNSYCEGESLAKFMPELNAVFLRKNN